MKSRINNKNKTHSLFFNGHKIDHTQTLQRLRKTLKTIPQTRIGHISHLIKTKSIKKQTYWLHGAAPLWPNRPRSSTLFKRKSTNSRLIGQCICVQSNRFGCSFGIAILCFLLFARSLLILNFTCSNQKVFSCVHSISTTSTLRFCFSLTLLSAGCLPGLFISLFSFAFCIIFLFAVFFFVIFVSPRICICAHICWDLYQYHTIDKQPAV